MKRLRLRPGSVMGSIAFFVELVGLAAFFWLSGWGLLWAAALHVVAVQCAVRAARRRYPDLSRAERDAVRLVAAAVPGFGPVLAWNVPAPRKEETPQGEKRKTVETAHEVFLRYREYVKPQVPDHERTLFSGDFHRDVARELDCESYHEVLRHGGTDQKRNALARLADLGEPRHLAMVRTCLRDPEHEVRLYAYGELSKIAREHEERIDRAYVAVSESPEDPDVRGTLAEAYLGFGQSGLLDPGMAAAQLREAHKHAERARQSGGEEVPLALLEARALCGLGRLDEAEVRLDALADGAGGAEAAELRAELCYLRRDFSGVRAQVELMEAAGVEPPRWMQAFQLEVPQETQS